MSYFDEVLIETPEEREAFEQLHRAQMIKRMATIARNAPTTSAEAMFEQLHRAQMIKRMATIARNAPTTSAEAICERLYDAGCKFND